MRIKEELTIHKLHRMLSGSQLTISTAESCTGCMISSELTKLPNSSLYSVVSFALLPLLPPTGG